MSAFALVQVLAPQIFGQAMNTAFASTIAETDQTDQSDQSDQSGQSESVTQEVVSETRQEKIDAFVSAEAPKEAHNAMPDKLKNVGVREQLGSTIDLTLTFKDHLGQTKRLGDFFLSGKPVLLSLNYYDCATLCTLQLTAVAQALQGMDWLPGRDFEVVTVSIDPSNTLELAAEKRMAYLEYIDKADANWHFLLPEDESGSNVIALAEQLGFDYQYDPETDQYAHAAVTYLLTPQGKISRYLYGINPTSRDVKFALMDASEGRLGSTIEKFVLNCFHYDELRGQYTPFAMSSMRIGGLFTVAGIGVWLGVLWKREKSKRCRENIA